MVQHLRNGDIAAADPDAVAKYLARSHGRPRCRSGFAWGVVAALVIFAAGFGALLYPLDSGRTYRTDVGQQMTITLPDRSMVDLNTDTELRVAYTEAASSCATARLTSRLHMTLIGRSLSRPAMASYERLEQASSSRWRPTTSLR